MLKHKEDMSNNQRVEYMNEKRVAFIKNDICDGKKVWAIYTEDGTKVADTENRDFAFLMAKRSNLQPHSVH